MANPLYAIALAVAVCAGAEPAAEHPFLQGLRARLAAAFIESPHDVLLDVSGQRDAALEAGATAEQFEALLKLADDGRAVQMGRRDPEESQDVFDRAVRDVARRLGAPVAPALEHYSGRVRPAGALSAAELAARIRVLTRVKAQLGPQGQRRMATRLRGYERALTEMTRRDAGSTTRGGAGVLGAFTGYQPASFVAAAAPNPNEGYMPASLVAPHALTPEQYRALNAQPAAQPPRSTTGEADVPQAPPARPTSFSTEPMPYGVAVGSLDGVRVRDLLEAARRLPVRTFGGWCLRWVKAAVQRAGLMEPPPRDQRREAARMQARAAFLGMNRAFKMGRLTQAQLEELGLQPIIPSSIPWAVNKPELNGFFLVWAPRCNGEEIGRSRRPPGAHPTAGHVEYIIPPDHPLARQAGVPADEIPVKSDGTRGTSPRVLETYSRDPQITRSWVDGASRGVPGLGRISQACLVVLAPLDLD